MPIADPIASLKLRRQAIMGALVVLFVVVPALNLAGVIEPYHVNRLGRYLCFAIAALGIDLIWGYAGVLSLCHALFFCAGGYAIAMHLSLPQGGGDVRPEYHNIPQFFSSTRNTLPLWWRPFASLPLPCRALRSRGIAPAWWASSSSETGAASFHPHPDAGLGCVPAFSRNELLLSSTNGLTNLPAARPGRLDSGVTAERRSPRQLPLQLRTAGPPGQRHPGRHPRQRITPALGTGPESTRRLPLRCRRCSPQSADV